MAALARQPRRALVLIGFMGAGKSTVAAELAGALGVQPQDSDELLEARLGHSIAREFELHGERSFRAAEEQLVLELLAAPAPGSVIALGGGSVLSEQVRLALEPHTTVFLDVDAQTAWQRICGDRHSPPSERPLAGDRESFFALHAKRHARYEQLADAFLPPLAEGQAPRTLHGLGALAAAPPDSRMIWARSASGEYPVLIGRGLLRAAGSGERPEIWPLERSQSRAFCVTDKTVATLYLETLGELTGMIAITPGEEHKTLLSAEHVWHAMFAAEIDRGDQLLALGGGVVGDLAGFCAATYQRGMPFVQIPTTLLAQVDSAYGGKTGIDLPEAKNYVGSYHQPAGVLVDPDTLASLPEAELAGGWVEVLKTALIAGGRLWESVARDEELDQQTIVSCARTKLAVVAADERDGGWRQVLNLGHTVGHAIEAASGYSRYRHGEAVGLGLLAALRLSGAPELRDQVHQMLLDRGLPVRLEGAPAEDVISAAQRDKKRIGSKLPFVLLDAPGRPRIGCEVETGELREAVLELATG